MLRLVLAVLLVAAIAAALLVLVLGTRAVMAGTNTRSGDNGMQKLAFALLVALVLYVAVFQGAA